MRALILLPVLLPALALCAEPARYSVRQARHDKPSRGEHLEVYVGNYGEVLKYSDEFTLLPPTLDHGMEIVRFYFSDLRRLDMPIPAPADYIPENFKKLDLAEVLIIPQGNGGYQDLDALRADKIKYLRTHGATFSVDADVKLDMDPWPPKSFMVYESSPTEMTQLYAAGNGLLFIATVGRDISKKTRMDTTADSLARHNFYYDDDVRMTMRDLLVYIGRYFETLAVAEHAREREKASGFNFRAGINVFLRTFAPSAILGLIFFILPWGRPFFRPMAAGLWSGAALGMVLMILGFYFSRQVLRWNLDSAFDSLWPWCTFLAPLPSLTYLLTRKSSPLRRAIVLGLCLIATAMLFTAALDGVWHMTHGDEPLTVNFSGYALFIGFFQGFCLGLAIDIPFKRRTGSGALALLVLVLAAPSARAQDGGRLPYVDPHALESPDVRTEAQRRVAQMRGVETDQLDASYRKDAVDDLNSQHLLYKFQRVEITGVFSTDDTNDTIGGFNDLELNPAHNKSPQSDPPWWNFWGRLKNFSGYNSASNDIEDIADLFDAKSGKLTDAAKEMLHPLTGDVNVNEIVAHSWGALILNEAILEGIIPPPQRIVVVGCPDADMTRWKLLAQKTGTEVVVFNNSADMVAGVPKLLDRVEGYPGVDAVFDRLYDEGRIGAEWTHWSGQDPAGRKKPGKFLALQADIGALGSDIATLGLDKSAGHARVNYYRYLLDQGVLDYLPALQRRQDEKIDSLAGELEETDVDRMVKMIQNERAFAYADSPEGQAAAWRDVLDGSIPTLRQMIVDACKTMGRLSTTATISGFPDPSYDLRLELMDLTDARAGAGNDCERTLALAVIALNERSGNFSVDWLNEQARTHFQAAMPEAAPMPQPAPQPEPAPNPAPGPGPAPRPWPRPFPHPAPQPQPQPDPNPPESCGFDSDGAYCR